jgi:hypothetical protein
VINRTEGPAPTFLICSERSGSNLISAMIGAHPEVYAHPPYHLGRDFILKLCDTLVGGTTSAAWEKLCRNAVRRVRQFRGEEEADALASWLSRQGELDPRAIAKFIWQQMPSQGSKRRFFVKENNVHRLLPFLVDCFPDARYIFQVRDPRDYFASAKAVRGSWLGNKFGSSREAIAVWHEDQSEGLAALALLGPHRVRCVRYEDLLIDGEGQLRAICDFLQLDFDPKMLEFYVTESAKQMAVEGGPRKNLSRPLMTDNFHKYRKQLSKGEIKTIEAHLGDLMVIPLIIRRSRGIQFGALSIPYLKSRSSG